MQVPRDISLVGFDDQQGLPYMPFLTSVHVDTEEIGRQLAKMAIAKIGSKGLSLNEVLIPTKLVKRDTCRPPATTPQGSSLMNF